MTYSILHFWNLLTVEFFRYKLCGHHPGT